MTQEDKKQLLMKDLCARLPFNVKCYDFWYNDEGDKIDTILTLDCIYPSIMKYKYKETDAKHNIERIKPYLRPLSNMTEEESNDLFNMKKISKNDSEYIENCIDYLLSHHFDYRGLIFKGLAIEAPENMYNN